jgi:hypothetical protein
MGKKQQKSKAIAFTFRPFLATCSIFHKWAKNSKKVRLYITEISRVSFPEVEKTVKSQ